MYPPSHRPFVRGQRVGAESGYCAIHGRKRLRADLEMLDANTGSLRCVSHKQCRQREAEEIVVCQLHHRPRNIHHMRMVAPQVYECLPQYICRPTRPYSNRTPHLAKASTAEQPVTTFSNTSSNRPESANNDRGYRAQYGRVNYITPENTTWMKRSAPTHSFSQNKSFVSSTTTKSMMSATPFADELRAQSELHSEQSQSHHNVNKEQGTERERRMNSNNSNWHPREQGQLMVGNTKYDTGEWSAPINTFTESPRSYPMNSYDGFANNDDNVNHNNINNGYEGNSLQFHNRYHSRRGMNDSREFYYPSERMVWCAYHGKQIALSQSMRLRESCFVCVDNNTCLTSPLNTTQTLYAMHCNEIMCELHGVLRSPAFVELNVSQTGYQCTRMHRCREAAVAMSTHTLTTNKHTSNAISNGEGEGYYLQSESAADSSSRNSYAMNDLNSNNNIEATNNKDSDNDDSVNDLAYYQDSKTSRGRLARSDDIMNEANQNVDTSLSNTISSFLV